MNSKQTSDESAGVIGGAERVNLRSPMDFRSDRLADGRAFRVLTTVRSVQPGMSASGSRRIADREKSRCVPGWSMCSCVMSGHAGRVFLRYVGSARTGAAVTMLNLAYNLVRYEQIVRLELIPRGG